MKTEILRMDKVTSIKDEVKQLDNFNMYIFKSEIMGLVCENSIGVKSLIHLICKNTPIQYGRVYFNDVLVNNYQHSTYTTNKISVIEQKSRLIEDLTVAENVFVLRKGFKKYLINHHVLNDQFSRFTKDIGVDIDGNELAANLCPYEKCIVELLRAVIMGAKLIIIKDISNSISSSGLIKIHNLLKYYCKKGFSFIYICNHHEEAFKICDRISLMKDGKILKVFNKEEFKNKNIEPYYISQYLNISKERLVLQTQKNILTFQNICTDNLNDMSFTASKGECTVLFDIDNTVLADIMKLMNGAIRQKSGKIFLENKEYTYKKARHAVSNGIVFINQNPVQSMLFKEMSYIKNLCFLVDRKPGIKRLNKKIFNSVINEYEPIIGKDIYETNIMNLKLQSLYDLVYYRIHLFNPKIVFCLQPFAGADMYLRRHLIYLINQLKKKGITVIILAVNMADSLVIADKLILLENGKFKRKYSRSGFNLFSSEGIIM